MTSFSYQQHQLLCESVPLADIAAQVGTPVYVYSQAELQRRALAYATAVPHNAVSFVTPSRPMATRRCCKSCATPVWARM